MESRDFRDLRLTGQTFVATSANWEDYKKWAATVPCAGCGKSKADRRPDELWLCEDLCWECGISELQGEGK